MKPWKEVSQTEEFKALPQEKRQRARDLYFQEVVAPKVAPEQRERAFELFAQDSDFDVVPEDTALEGFSKAAGNVVPGVVGAGAGLIHGVMESGDPLRALSDNFSIDAEFNKLMDRDVDSLSDAGTFAKDYAVNRLNKATNFMGALTAGIPAQVLSELFPDLEEDAAIVAREASAQMSETAPRFQDPLSLKNIAATSIQSGLENALPTAAAVATRRPGMALKPMTAMAAGREYTEQREAGQKSYEALPAALAQGAAEAIGEKLPLSQLLRTDIGSIGKRVANTAISDALGEGVTSVLQSAIDLGTISPDMTLEEALTDLGVSVGAGGLTGGAYAIPTQVASNITDRNTLMSASDSLPETSDPLEAAALFDPVEREKARLREQATTPAETQEQATPDALQAEIDATEETPAQILGMEEIGQQSPEPVTAGEFDEVINGDRPIEEIVADSRGYKLIDNVEAVSGIEGDRVWYDEDADAYIAYDTETGGFAEPVPLETVARQNLEKQGTKTSPIFAETETDIQVAEEKVNTTPTEAQKEAGNYKKGHIKIDGLDISIENPKGSIRSGIDPNGQPWEVEMPVTYGYIKRSEGADGDQVDVYVGSNPQSPTVYIIDQKDADTGKFDEHKAMLGFNNEVEATQAYQGMFSDGRAVDRVQSVSKLSMPEFKQWLRTGNTKQPYQTVKQPTKQAEQRQVPQWAKDNTPSYEQMLRKRIMLRKKKNQTEEDAQLMTYLNERIGSVQANRKRKPRRTGDNILHFISDLGGAKDAGGDLAALGAGDWHRGKRFQRKLINNDQGLDLDDITMAAWEAGYFHNDADATGERPSINDLLTLVENSLSGINEGLTLDQSLDAIEQLQEDPAEREAAIQSRAAELGATEEQLVSFNEAELLEYIAEREAVSEEGYTEEQYLDIVNTAIEEALMEAYDGIEFDEESVLTQPERTESADEGLTRPEPAEGETAESQDVATDSKTGRQNSQEAQAPVEEQTDQGTQTVVPGAERISDKQLAERKMQERMQAKRPQKSAGEDGGLFDLDGQKQGDLLDTPLPAPKGTTSEQNTQAKDTSSSPNTEAKPSEPGTEKPTGAQKKPAVSTIEDVGEKIGGARKDIWAERNLNVEDLSQLGDRELYKTVKKDKVFPKPDYEAMTDAYNEQLKDRITEDRMDKLSQSDKNLNFGAGLAYTIKSIRDSIAQPQQTWKREKYENYVRGVEMVRERLQDLPNIAEMQNLLYDIFGKDIVVNRRFDRNHPNYKYFDALGSKFVKAIQVSTYDITRNQRKAQSTGFPAKQEAWQRTYTVTKGSDLSINKGGRRIDGEWKEGYFLAKGAANVAAADTLSAIEAEREKVKDKYYLTKTKGGYRIEGVYNSREEAVAAAKESLTSKSQKAKVQRPVVENITRDNMPERRKGDVTAEQFIKDFGFRGAEFGNWMTNDDRQVSINYAYDAFMDLAEILGLPPKALSLNGELALAFGARGQSKAKAHYEPSKVVINLTKMKGAGALAHEWAHAMDDYFGRVSGNKSKTSTNRSDVYVSHGFGKDSKARQEVIDAWSDVMDKILKAVADSDSTIRQAESNVTKRRDNLQRILKPFEYRMSKSSNDATKEAFTAKVQEMMTKPAKEIYHGTNYESTFQTILDASELLKEGTGRGIRKEDRTTITRHLYWLYKDMEKRDQALAGKVVKKTDSDFYKEATKIDRATGGTKRYWSAIHELFARAFESYAQDKVRESGTSDYLVWGADNTTYMLEDVKPYPEGDQRVEINEAFDKLFEVIETKTDGDNVAMYSRRTEGLTDEQLPEGVKEVPDREDIAASTNTKWNTERRLLREKLKAHARTIFGEGLNLDVMDKVYGYNSDTGKWEEVDGVQFPRLRPDGLEQWALLSLDEESLKPSFVLDHEGIHFLKRMGALDKVYKELESFARKEWIDRFAIEERYTQPEDMSDADFDALVVEEAIADAFAAWMEGSYQPKSNRLQRFFRKIRQWLGLLKNELNNADIKRAEDIFSGIKQGDYRVNSKLAQDASTGVKYTPRYSRRKPGEYVKEAKKRLKDSGQLDATKKWMKRNFTKEGLLTTRMFENKIGLDADKNAFEMDVQFHVKDLETEVRKAYGKPYSELTDAQARSLKDYLAGDQDASVPAAIKPEADRLRSFLDTLSAHMQDSLTELMQLKIKNLSKEEQDAANLYLDTNGEQGKVPPSVEGLITLMGTIEANKGSYLHRSYQAFDDPKWKDKALANKKLIAEAESFIAEQNPDLSAAEVTGAVRAILQQAYEKGNFASYIANGTKVGSKDVSILKRRKEVPPEIRALLGEYQDPKVNFVRSATKMTMFVANHRFLVKMREQNLGGLFHKRPKGEFDTRIAAEGNAAMNPLDGLYTHQDILTGMKDVMENPLGQGWLDYVIRVNSMIKYGKTILAPTTQFRNFMSAAMFSLYNGHSFANLGTAFKGVKASLLDNDKEWRAYVRKLIQLGVIHDNPYSEELRLAIQDVVGKNPIGLRNKAAKALMPFQKAYQAGDDFWKINGFENEKALLMKHKGMTEAQAELEAAERIRNGYPTYSMVPRSIRALRRFPLVGTFVSFPWEIGRTSLYNAKLIANEWQNGSKTLAARRAFGASSVLAASAALSYASMLMMGIDGEDDEAIRSLAAPWQRNAQLLYLGYDKDGMPTYLDLSHLDPYTYIKQPITAILNGNNSTVQDKVIDSFRSVLEPFLGIDIGTQAIMEVVNNQKWDGGKIYEPADSWEGKTAAIVKHLTNLAPGFVSNIERTYKAYNDEVSRSGKQYTLRDEALAFVGFRMTTMNTKMSIIYKGYQLQDMKRSAASLLGYVASDAGTVTNDDMRSAYMKMLTARKDVYSEMLKSVNAARKLGISDTEIRELLSASGISKSDIFFLTGKGSIPPWQPSRQFLKNAEKRLRAASTHMSPAAVGKELQRRRAYIQRLTQETGGKIGDGR